MPDCLLAVRENVWAVNHKTLEKISVHLGITFDPPVPLEVGPDFVALCVTGRLGDMSAWSVGRGSLLPQKQILLCHGREAS